VVVEVEGKVEGALLVVADESPVAWVRLAAVSDALRPGRWLDVSLPPIVGHLRTLDVRRLAWMDHGEWARPFLKARGFRPSTDVITLTKTDRVAPRIDASPVLLRPASKEDFGRLATIDRRAFEPVWWRSEASMRRRAASTSRFVVAECGGRVVGYAERELHPPTAHLNRIAVDPDYQGQAIGATLLKQVLVSLWQAGAAAVSLNTQRTNRRSRRLYERFGFKWTGDSVTVWELQL
jgi:ribosomal protein S18 acetylase RimI-like enzyme